MRPPSRHHNCAVARTAPPTPPAVTLLLLLLTLCVPQEADAYGRACAAEVLSHDFPSGELAFDIGGMADNPESESCDELRLLPSEAHIGDAGATRLANQVVSNRQLHSLVLPGQGIGDNGAKALAEAIDPPENNARPGIEWLSLYNNSIGPKGARALGRASGSNPVLTMLDLSRNPIGVAGARAFSRYALSADGGKNLRRLQLNYCNLGDRGIVALTEKADRGLDLKSLGLAFNNIRDAGAQALAWALHPANGTLDGLTTLSLEGNRIGDEGAIILAGAISYHRTLRELDLAGNRISDEGLLALESMLENNRAIVDVHLEGNRFHDNDVRRGLQRKLQRNQKLRDKEERPYMDEL